MKKLLLSVAMAGALASPAAAATISFTNGATSNPSWTSAQVIQSFNTQAGPFLSLNTTITPTGYATESLSGGGAARISLSDPSMVGKFLTLTNGESYTLDFGTKSVQFLSFLVDNYRSTNHVKLTLSDGSIVSNALNGLAGLNNGLSGLVIFDQQGGLGIKSIQFQTGSGDNSSFSIDQIAVAAPEPATWGMMLLGFGIVGSQLRRRRKSVLATA
ncbi:MAG TPA: PEPxxWA-CTERM sorting domain-containing protein [Novosphingobium sp.]